MAMTNAPGDAVTGLLQALARVQRHHIERNASPELAQALAHLGAWQSRRLRNTYADLERSPRYARAMKYFQSDLYGGADFAQRDADLVRVVPAMRVLIACRTFLLDVGKLTARGELAIPADHATAGQRSKPKEPHETHSPILRRAGGVWIG